MSLAIETVGLSRYFGDRIAVNSVNLCVPTHSIYGFLGRNGAGKTTTIKLLLGLIAPDVGTIRIAGFDVIHQRMQAARKVGALLEAQGFYPHLSGRENLDLSRRLLELPAAEVDRVLDVVDMATDANRRVGDYSLGMRQRLGLARALLGAPPVLILDEPTNGLDPEGIADMRRFLRALPERANATVLLSSHLLSEIEQTATHVGILNHGQLVLEGALDDLKSNCAIEVEIGTDTPDQAAQVARQHGFDATCDDTTLVARFMPCDDVRTASAALNHALCAAGIGVHTILQRQRSLETLYHHAAASTASGT